MAASDDDALEGLQAFLITFFDLHIHADGVAGSECRNITALGFGEELFDDLVRHDRIPSSFYIV